MRERRGLVERVTRQLAEARREAGVTQEVLAELLDVPVQHISRIEAGQNVTLVTLERFAMALGLSVSVIFEKSKDGPTKPPPSRRQRTRAKKPGKVKGGPV